MTSTRDRVLDFLAARYRASIKLVPVEKVSNLPYRFEPGEWDVFAVLDSRELRLGATEHIAVNRTTGEVRDLGLLGE